MEFDKIFWNASLDEIKKGYVYNSDEKTHICLCCAKTFEKGIIYNINNVLMDSEKAINQHVKNNHNSMYNYLINMDKKYTGITDNQKNLMSMFYQGFDDKTIANEIGGSSSTVRNQRFTLREKAKQAKIYLAIMELLEEKMNDNDQLVHIHRNATNVDERYAITEREKDEFIKKYFDGNKLLSFPKKQKRIIVVLQQIILNFDENRKYTENEVNTILKTYFDDYVTIRRYLIEYGFMERTIDCKEYWRKI